VHITVHTAQFSTQYSTEVRTVLIFCPSILHMIVIVLMLCIGGDGGQMSRKARF